MEKYTSRISVRNRKYVYFKRFVSVYGNSSVTRAKGRDVNGCRCLTFTLGWEKRALSSYFTLFESTFDM